MPRDEGGIEGVTYPLVADTNKTISADCNVLVGEYGDLMVDALQRFEENGELCPMDREKGADAMEANHESTAAYLAK